MLLVRLLVSSRLLVVKIWGSQKLYMDFQLCKGLVPQAPVLFQGSLTLFSASSDKIQSKAQSSQQAKPLVSCPRPLLLYSSLHPGTQIHQTWATLGLGASFQTQPAAPPAQRLPDLALAPAPGWVVPLLWAPRATHILIIILLLWEQTGLQ